MKYVRLRAPCPDCGRVVSWSNSHRGLQTWRRHRCVGGELREPVRAR